MKSIEGAAYRDLKNAFRYRKEYVADCTCRGHPWDAEAIARHRAYAGAAKEPKDKAAVKSVLATAVQERPTGKCKVVETRPTETNSIHGPLAFKTRDEAETQVTAVCKTKK
jgi:uncharacterized protein DUF2865